MQQCPHRTPADSLRQAFVDKTLKQQEPKPPFMSLEVAKASERSQQSINPTARNPIIFVARQLDLQTSMTVMPLISMKSVPTDDVLPGTFIALKAPIVPSAIH